MHNKNSLMSSQEIDSSLEKLNRGKSNNWDFSANKIKKQFILKNFDEAINFMVDVGKHAEELNHHPEWCNVYNKVSIELTTHSAKGLTELDFVLANRIEEEYNKRSQND